MCEDTRTFLQVAFEECATACLTLTAIHPSGKHPTPSRHLPLADSQLLTQALADLQHANRLGWGAYFSVATRRAGLGRWQRGGKADLVQLPALFVDLDEPLPESLDRLERFSLTPSCVVASGRGLHAYWWISPPTADWSRAQRALNALRNSLQADKTSPVSCLRLPNSLNTKPERHQARCRIVTLTDTRYPLEAFEWDSPTPQTARPPHRYTPPHSRRVQAVAEALLYRYGGRYKRNGWLEARCPLPHQRDGVGVHFAFNPESGVGVCLGKHGTLPLSTLSHLLHL